MSLPVFEPLSFSTMLGPIEKLLQLMLRWDPFHRGGPVNRETKRPSCFEQLELILSMKVRLLERLIGSIWVNDETELRVL